MSVLATLASLLILPGFAIAQISAPYCTSPNDWTWSFNSLNQNPCTVAAYLGSTCDFGSYTVEPLMSGDSYPGPTNLASDSCQCSTVMYSLLSACGACQGGGLSTWSEYSYNCPSDYISTGVDGNSFPNPVPSGTRVPYWASLYLLGNSWNAVNSYYAGGLPETYPGEFIEGSNFSSPYSPPSTSPGSLGGKAKANGGAIAGGVIAGVACIAIGVTIFYYLRQRNRVRGPPESSTANDYSQALHHESAVSGASQAPSVGSPINSESLMSHSGSWGMGGLQVSPIVSGFNTVSQEPLESPLSAITVHAASQPHMGEDRQSAPNYVTISPSLRAWSSPTQMTIDTPNVTTPYPESSRGAPSVPSVPSQLPTSLYPASVGALTNTQASHQGEYHDPPIA